MFLILLRYIKPLSEVDRHVEAHREFLRRGYASGHFLLSGPKAGRTGGVILAQGATRAEIESLGREDPFYTEGISEFEVVEFHPTMAAEALSHLQGT